MTDAAVNKLGKWNVGDKGGINGPFFSVVGADGRIIALQIPERETAETIASIPALKSKYATACALLKEVVRVRYETSHHCPICHHPNEGHSNDCKLAAWMKEQL